MSDIRVKCILNAERYQTENDLPYWVYTVQWSDNGFSTSLENEFHPVFQDDPSILQLFWDLQGIDPNRYNLNSVIPATENYINERHQNLLPSSSKTKRERSTSPSPSDQKRLRSTGKGKHDSIPDSSDRQNLPTVVTIRKDDWSTLINIDSDSDTDSLFGDQQSFIPLKLSNGEDLITEAMTNEIGTPATSLPPIEVLDDLPDFEDLDIVEIRTVAFPCPVASS